MINLNAEREQLVATWKSALNTRWIEKPRACVSSLISPDETSFGMHFRQTHNIFGWMAGNTLANRGLCSGAIYRSERFLELSQIDRSGSAGPRKSLVHLQNVHIEHTVPIAVLNRLWAEYRKGRELSLAAAYAWMFVHSVSTAVHMAEKGGLGSYESRTDTFDPASPHYNLPFMRYSHRTEPLSIWNVMTGERINPGEWTFASHFSMIEALLDEAGADVEMASMIRIHAAALVLGISSVSAAGGPDVRNSAAAA